VIVMVNFWRGSDDSDSVRMALLKHYSLQCIAHGIYIFTVAIGLLGFVVALPIFWSIEIITRSILLGLISSILLALTVHILGRTLFWSHLASAVLSVTPKREGEIKIENGTTVTSPLLLHQASVEYVRRKHKVIGAFHTTRMWEIELWLIFLTGLSLIWLIVSL